MLAIRLQRVGRKNDPSFRVVLVDSKRSTKSGRFSEVLGSYDARKGEPQLKSERIRYWLSVGAKPSGTVHNLFIAEKLIEGKKVNVLPKKSPPKKEEKQEKEPKNPLPASPLPDRLAGSKEVEEATEEGPIDKEDAGTI